MRGAVPVARGSMVLAVLLAVTALPALGQEVQREQSADSVREAPQGVAPEAASIGFIDSPSAFCYQPDPRFDVCYINWYYISVSASPNYMIWLNVILNPDIVNRIQGFFQTSMYLPYNAVGKGFRVACGSLGAGGNPDLGNAYAYTIRAQDSQNLTSANYGTVYCPAFIP